MYVECQLQRWTSKTINVGAGGGGLGVKIMPIRQKFKKKSNLKHGSKNIYNSNQGYIQKVV